MEAGLRVQPCWLCLDPVATVIQCHKERWFAEFFPGLLVIGSNGVGEAIAFDTNKPAPYPIVYFDMTNSDLEESVVLLAATFKDLLELIGDMDASDAQ